jgi:hypothetical protein
VSVTQAHVDGQAHLVKLWRRVRVAEVDREVAAADDAVDRRLRCRGIEDDDEDIRLVAAARDDVVERGEMVGRAIQPCGLFEWKSSPRFMKSRMPVTCPAVTS